MDIRDFLYKIDAIQNKEQMKADVKRTHIKEASQVMLYGDTPADMAAIAQIFRNAGITPPPAIAIGPKPEESVAEDITNKGNNRANEQEDQQIKYKKIFFPNSIKFYSFFI